MLEVSRTSIKKADQDLENICFYSLGWPNKKQSTQIRLPSSTCIKNQHLLLIEKSDINYLHFSMIGDYNNFCKTPEYITYLNLRFLLLKSEDQREIRSKILDLIP